MRCLVCGEKVARLRYWKTKSEFCSDEHAETHKRQTLDRLMQSQEELLARPPLPIGDDSGPMLPDLEPSFSEASGLEGAAADTTPRIDRSHRLHAAQDETLAEQPASDFASAEVPEELNDPLQPLMEATDRRPIFDGSEPAAGGQQPAQEQRRFEGGEEQPLGGAADEGAATEGSGDRDAILRRLMSGADDERPAISDLFEDSEQETEREADSEEALAVSPDESAASSGSSLMELLDGLGTPEPTPAEGAARENTVRLRKLGEGTLHFTEGLMPPAAPDEHAWDDAAEGGGGPLDLATALGIHEPAIESYESAPPTAPDTFDSISCCKPQVVVAGDLTETFSGPGSNWATIEPYFSELSAPVLGQVEDFAGREAVGDAVVPAFQVSVPSFDTRPVYSTGFAAWLSRAPDTSEMKDVQVGSRRPDIAFGKPRGMVAEGRTETLSGSGTKLVTIEPHFSELSAAVSERIEDFARREAVGETAFLPLQVFVPSFDVQPVHSAGLAAWSSPMNETPDLVGTLDAPGSWRPEGCSARASAPAISPVVPNPGTGFAGSTSVLFGLRPIEWTSLRLTAPTPRLEDACEVEPVEVAEDLNPPSIGCQVPGFTIVPVPRESCRQGITLADMRACAKPEAIEVEAVVPNGQQEVIPALPLCVIPADRPEGLPGERCCRGMVPTDMVWWVNPESMVEQGVPAAANWTGPAEQPRRNLDVPVDLLAGAIRSVRQFPRFGYLLKSVAGEALMQGMQAWDTTGILPVLAINERVSRPEPFSVLQLESCEAALDAIGPAPAVYAPADLDPCEYAYYGE